jgi:hypothetical protein
MAMPTSGRCPARHLPRPPLVATSWHGTLPMPGQTTEAGRTTEADQKIREGAPTGQGQAPGIIAAAKARATVAVTGTTDPPARSVHAQVKGTGPRRTAAGINMERAQRTSVRTNDVKARQAGFVNPIRIYPTRGIAVMGNVTKYPTDAAARLKLTD